MADEWPLVARGSVSSDGLEGEVWTALSDLLSGDEAVLQLNAWGIGPFMDGPGVEAVAQQAFNMRGVDVTVLDCYGEGWSDGFIRIKGSPAGVLAIIGAISLLLTLLFFLGSAVVVALYLKPRLLPTPTPTPPPPGPIPPYPSPTPDPPQPLPPETPPGENWTMVARGEVSSSGVQGDVWKLLDELPVGTDGLLQLDAWGIGPIMDSGGVELMAQAVLRARGIDATILDCYGEGWSKGFIRFKGSPVALLPLLAALAPILYALGFIAIVVVVGVFIIGFVKEPEKFTIPFLVIGGLVIGGIVAVNMSRGGKR